MPSCTSLLLALPPCHSLTFPSHIDRSIIVVPAAIYPFLLRSYNLVDNDDDDGDDDDINFNSSDFFKVRIISFGIFFGTFLLFFVPIFVWKFVVRIAFFFLTV